MKKLYMLFLFVPILFSGQESFNQEKVDSLYNELNRKKADTAKVNVYLELFEQYSSHDLKKSRLINIQIEQLSKKSNYELGIAFYNYNHILFYDFDHSIAALPYVEKASILFLKNKNIEYYLSSQSYIADVNFNFGNQKKAKRTIIETLPIAIKTNFNYQIGTLYTLLGRIYYEEGLLRMSLQNYNKALAFFNKDKLSIDLKMMLYFFMSFTHIDLENYKQALFYLNTINSNKEEPSVNIELATTYIKMKDFKKALHFLLRNKKMKMTEFEGYNTVYLMSKVYLNLNQYKLAIANLNSIINLETNKNIQLNSYNVIAKSYLQLHNIKKAQEFNDKASYLVSCTNIEDARLDYYLCKSDIAIAAGDYKEALLSYKKCAALKEENFIKKNKDKITDLQLDFEVAEKDNNIKNLNVAQLKKTIQINKQTSYITYGLIFIVFIIIGLLLFLRVFNIIKKKNKLIGISNKKLENTQVQLEKSLHTKETLLKEIHHRVKNNLQLVMSLLYIQSREKETNIKDFLEISQSRILAMALIHENLYQTEDLSRVDFKEYVNSLTQSIVTSFNNLHQDIQLKIELQDIYLDIQTAIPLGLIINELISNAYKHAFVNHKKGTITLQLIQKETNYELTIKDDGVGINETVTRKKSLGLELVNQLVNQISGVLQIQNNAGMQYSIQFQNITV